MQPLSSEEAPDPSPTERVAELASGQGGRLAHRQLTTAGLSRGVIRTWIRKRILIPVPNVPRIYALGYLRTDRTARLWDALLFAGPGAYLTGAPAAYELGLLFYEPAGIKVATPRRRPGALPNVVVLDQRPATFELHNGLPHASMPELLLELAAEGNVPILRRALESLDYQRKLDMAATHHACKKGRKGSQLLKAALARRLPQLAFCKSPLEVDFLIDIIEAHHLPLPIVNQTLHGVEPDMYWPRLNLVVELDGDANHHSAAQKRRDAAKDALLRSHGITVIRLSHEDVHKLRGETLWTLAGHGLSAARPGV